MSGQAKDDTKDGIAVLVFETPEGIQVKALATLGDCFRSQATPSGKHEFQCTNNNMWLPATYKDEDVLVQKATTYGFKLLFKSYPNL